METARNKVIANFELCEKLGVEYDSFHDALTEDWKWLDEDARFLLDAGNYILETQPPVIKDQLLSFLEERAEPLQQLCKRLEDQLAVLRERKRKS